MSRYGPLLVVALLACNGPRDDSTVGRRLSVDLARRCSDAPLMLGVADGDTAAVREVAAVSELLDSVGFRTGWGLTALAPWDAQTLCALREPPLLPGEHVIRLIRQPSFAGRGPSFVVRIERNGLATELSSAVLGLCRFDSISAASPRVWDGRDTLIMIPDLLSPGRVHLESRRRVSRRLFRDALAYLDEKDFWVSEGVIPIPDGHPAFLEVQLGDRYKVLQLPAVFSTDEGLFQLIREAGLLSAGRCPWTSPSSHDEYGWLVNDGWRVPAGDAL